MLNYTDEQIKREVETILATNDFTIKPVGNHYLKRHLVYQIDMNNGEKYIFKLYYRNRRRSREIASLKLLKNSEVKCPKIFKFGNLGDGSQWLISNYIDGEIFDKVMRDISYDNRIKIFQEMGKELGKLHSYKIFDFFGEWDEEGKSINNIKSYYDYFVNGMEKDINEVINQSLPDKDILIKAIGIIRENYEILRSETVSRLVHKDFDGRNLLVNKDNGIYKLSGVIDFEVSYPGNAEENFVQLYFKYFIDNKDYENAFFGGYREYMHLDYSFKERLYIYLLCFVVGNCSWAYIQAPDYYNDNIQFLKNMFK